MIALFLTRPARAAERVDFVIGPDAPALEADAANESAAQFQKLFGVETAIGKAIPGDAAHVVLIGSPATNPAIKDALGYNWPQTSDQGIVIRSFDRNGKPALVLGGGSPAATFWAVCEFGYRNGVRYLLREDVFPPTAPLKLDGHDIVMEPALRTRAWRTINDFATGPEGWSATDQKKLFRQLAKMKFNRITLAVYPWQPFVDYEFKGVKKQTAQLWYGEKFRVDGDTPGKIAFGGAQYFENPDFAGKKTYEEITAAGVQYVRTLIDAAHDLGMSAELSILPLEFPSEFASVLPRLVEGGENVTSFSFSPRIPSMDSKEDVTLHELVRTVLTAHLSTYSKIDAVCLELRPPIGWGSSDHIIRKELADPDQRKKRLKLEHEYVRFLQPILADRHLWKRPDGQQLDVTLGELQAEDLQELLSGFPVEASLLTSFHDRPGARVQREPLPPNVPFTTKTYRLAIPLTNLSAALLPQSSVQRIANVVAEHAKYNWEGFVVRHWAPGEIDPSVHYLSRASFDPQITAQQAFDELFVTITGKQAASDRLWIAFAHIEQATKLIDKHEFGFALPEPRMMTKHFVAEPAPSWWKDVIAHYTESSNELYRSHDAAAPRSRKLLFYYAKRSEYVLEYLTAVGAVRAAAIAKKEGNADEATAQLETAIEQMYNALDTLSDIARDQSDRGLIAVLAEYAYRPLIAKLEEADAEQK